MIKPQQDLIPGQLQERTTYLLRKRGNLDLPITHVTRLNSLANSFFPSAARSWNELSQEIKKVPSVTHQSMLLSTDILRSAQRVIPYITLGADWKPVSLQD